MVYRRGFAASSCALDAAKLCAPPCFSIGRRCATSLPVLFQGMWHRQLSAATHDAALRHRRRGDDLAQRRQRLLGARDALLQQLRHRRHRRVARPYSKTASNNHTPGQCCCLLSYAVSRSPCHAVSWQKRRDTLWHMITRRNGVQQRQHGALIRERQDVHVRRLQRRQHPPKQVHHELHRAGE